MGTLPVYQLNITLSVAYANVRIYVRNERTNETLNADTDSNGQTIIECSNAPSGVATGDNITIFTVYQDYQGSTTHTVTSGGADITLTLTAVPASDTLRYFTVQDYYDYIGYASSDTDIVKAQDIVKVGTDIEKEIDEETDRRFDSANSITSEYLDMKNSYQHDFYLHNLPIQTLTGFFVNDASEGSEYEWRNLAYTLLDDFTVTTNWTGTSGGSDTIALTINYTGDNVNHGITCMNIAKSGTNNATVTISRSNVTSTDFTDKTLNVDVYTIDDADLTTTNCVEIRFGSDSSNYFYKKWSKTSFSDITWTTLNMAVADSDCDVTGSPDITTCDYFAVIFTLAAVTTELTAGDLRLDHLRIGNEYDIEVDSETGRVRITDSDNYPEVGANQIKADYTYGYSTIPRDIRRLAILMTARHFMLTAAMRGTASGREFNPSVGFIDAEIKRILERNAMLDIKII